MAANGSYTQYVERMARIRTLSSPELPEIDDAEGYAERLRECFLTIGKLANVNHSMLDDELYPLLNTEGPLNDEQVAELTELTDGLLNVGGIEEYENLDLPLASLVSSRLMTSAEAQKDLPRIIRQLDTEIVACYSLMNMTYRIVTRPDIAEGFRAKGLQAGEFLMDLLEPERFCALPDPELRDIVLTNARFSTAFYEHVAGDHEANERNLDILRRMWEISEDPLYQEAVSEFDWRYFRFRVLEYSLQCTEILNARGFDEAQLAWIADQADEMERYCAEDPAYIETLIGHRSLPVLCARSRYLAGRISRYAYLATLLAAYDERDPTDFGSDGCDTNIIIPLEIICLVSDGVAGADGCARPSDGAAGADGSARPSDGAEASSSAGAGAAGDTVASDLSAEDAALLTRLYRSLSAYLFHMPNVGSLSFVLEYYSEVVERFVEVPGGVTFEEFVLQLIAALHPPTYVHSRMVAKLTRCLCRHMVRLMPERLVGLLGCADKAEVARRGDELVDFAYHAALCHDFGKAAIIDTIFMYGRRLLDFEFAIIKTHPDMGAHLLSRHASTQAWADVARGHHRWHDDSRGYPEEFVTAESPIKVLIDLVACTDCMDAATDSIGRTYKNGKTLDDFLGELCEGAGTRYAAWLPGLVEDADVQLDLRELLDTGRRQTYQDAYALLRDVTRESA